MKRGAGSTKTCPRRGYVVLTTKIGTKLAVPTTCKTWGCLGCRDRKRAEIRSKIQYGCYVLGRSWFITLTYRMGEGLQRNADTVREDWAKLLRCWSKEERTKKIAWFRVVELTKQSQPHLHLIVANLGGLRRGEITAMIRKQWLTISGDSYIIKVKPVLTPAGAAYYLTKYLVKGMLHREELERLGFDRRYSASANWPRGHLGPRGTEEERWYGVQFVNPGYREGIEIAKLAESSKGHYLLDRVGDEYLQTVERDRRRYAIAKQFKGVLESENNRA